MSNCTKGQSKKRIKLQLKRRDDFLHFLDARSSDFAEKRVYIGSMMFLKNFENLARNQAKCFLTQPTEYLLLKGHSLKIIGHYTTKLMEISEKPMKIILDIGYELIEHLSTTAIVAFADHIAEFASVYGHKLVLATMTIVPSLQGLQSKFLEVNKAFNEINLKNNFTPHYGVRSVMKYNKPTKNFKIRTSLWEEWKNNVGFGQTLDGSRAIRF